MFEWIKRFFDKRTAVAESPSALPAEIPPILRTVQRFAWVPVVQPGVDALGASKFGGLPLSHLEEALPSCGHCGKLMTLFLQLSSTDLPAEAGRPFGEGILQVFYCLSQAPLCEVEAQAFSPFSKASLVRVLSPDPLNSVVEISGPHPFFTGLITGWRQLEDFPNSEESDALNIELYYGQFEDLAERYPHSGDKLLGWPNWVQRVEYPSCRTCGRQMRYLFQIDSENNVPYMFGDVGCGHVFQCPEHPDEMTFGWACC